MKYKNVLISSHGDIILMVVDLKKHRKKEHVDWIGREILKDTEVESLTERGRLIDTVKHNLKQL